MLVSCCILSIYCAKIDTSGQFVNLLKLCIIWLCVMYCNCLPISLQDCEDHALLLCSLLLGFGLNAYICIGCKAGGVAHTWVMTIAPDNSITFWESLTAERSPSILHVMCKFYPNLFDRFSHKSVDPDHPAGVPVPQLEHPYRSIGCVFNHQSFYANCQVCNGSV